MNDDQVEITIDGKTYTGRYTIERKTLTVHSGIYGSKSTQLGAIPPETLAKMLLREIILASK